MERAALAVVLLVAVLAAPLGVALWGIDEIRARRASEQACAEIQTYNRQRELKMAWERYITAKAARDTLLAEAAQNTLTTVSVGDTIYFERGTVYNAITGEHHRPACFDSLAH